MRDKILVGASDLFLTYGFKSVTMDDIANKLGISKKTIYLHFDNKTKLVEATTMYLFDSISCGIDHICQLKKNPIEEIYNIKQFISEHLKMIEYKTAVLVGAAMKMGAIVSQASIEDQNSMYHFGKNLGIAFQLQDDYLDAFGDPKSFGKQVGGDIIENKKTYLYLKALEFSNEIESTELKSLFSITPQDSTDKIERTKQLFISSGSAEATKQAIQEYTDKAFSILQRLNISEDKKELLKMFGNSLINRTV